MERRRRLWGALVVGVLVLTGRVSAHETDQFTVPLGKQFADLSDSVTAYVYGVVATSVDRTNERIRHAREVGRSEAYIERLQSPQQLAQAVFYEFKAVFFLIEYFENMVRYAPNRRKYAGRLMGYSETFRNIYRSVHFPLDPRQIFRLWAASTIKAYGVEFGPDKIGHIADIGWRYYATYHEALAEGASHDEAWERAIAFGSQNFLFSERGTAGLSSVGAYSNADLVSNYVGFKFYLNMTEPVRLKGEMRQPMAIRDGEGWKLSAHVRPDSDFFAWYVTDHFNEALNPSFFRPSMRQAVHDSVKARSDRVLEWYADDNGNRRSKAYFDALVDEFRTYYGEDYGHDGTDEELITIGNACFEPVPTDLTPGERSRNGYTALHWASHLGDVTLARQLLDEGAAVDERVASLEVASSEWQSTALHLAAAGGHVDMVDLLLGRGASVNAASSRGATPLHRAIAYPEVSRRLLAAGADPDAVDVEGRTPLHWLARYPTQATVGLLLDAGADVDARDHRRRTPLHRAARWGNTQYMTTLLAAGAPVDARAHLQTTPLHFAVTGGQTVAVDLLIAYGADVNARDEFGYTPLHEAARRGTEPVRLLVAAGADINAADHYGSRPLHLAAQSGPGSNIEVLVAAGAAIDAANAGGSTPLHEGVFAGRPDIYTLLTELGADPTLCNAQGQTALDLASWERSRRLAVLRLSATSGRAPAPASSLSTLP